VDSQLLGQLELGKQTVIFYLVEEALNNARKHAQASEIIVRLFFHPKAANIAVLEIADNGVGFDVKAVMNSYTQRSSMGMVNLQERSELIDGSLQIDSVIGKGTRVRILIPLDQEAKDRLQQNELSGS
jgi:two-component system sensor histidine kinase DegS